MEKSSTMSKKRTISSRQYHLLHTPWLKRVRTFGLVLLLSEFMIDKAQSQNKCMQVTITSCSGTGESGQNSSGTCGSNAYSFTCCNDSVHPTGGSITTKFSTCGGSCPSNYNVQTLSCTRTTSSGSIQVTTYACNCACASCNGQGC